MKECRLLPCMLVLATSLYGCAAASNPAAYRTVAGLPTQNLQSAREANERGLRCVEQGDLVAAEAEFRAALAADLSFAAAHNNLGNVLAKQGKWHESALEYSYASKLQPQVAEPVINLGRLYETIGFHEEAIAHSERAVGLDPNHTDALGLLAHAYLGAGKNAERAEELLHQLARRDSLRWKSWAVAQLDRRRPSAP